MIVLRDERITHSILHFAQEHKKKTRDYLCQTALYKYLAFFDFKSLIETGEPALNLRYSAMDYGPVPVEIYIEKKYQSTESYHFETFNNIVRIKPVPKAKVNLDFFSEYEIELMGKLLYFFATKWVTAKVISDSSHKEIRAWKVAYERKKNSIIQYREEFKDDIVKRYSDGTSSLAEEHFIIYSALHDVQ